jgi:hypothetical protein
MQRGQRRGGMRKFFGYFLVQNDVVFPTVSGHFYVTYTYVLQYGLHIFIIYKMVPVLRGKRSWLPDPSMCA